MCGRFYIDDFVFNEIERHRPNFKQIWSKKQLDPREFSDPPRPRDVYPTNYVPVIIQGASGLDCTVQQWGFPNFTGKGVIINARSETALEKRTFKESVGQRRCIIPATWFYEWNQSKEKVAFFREDDNILYIAGFYNKIDGNDKFVILTTEANESMADIHNRMPLILDRNQLEEWICDNSKTEELLHKDSIQLKRRIDYEQQTLKFD